MLDLRDTLQQPQTDVPTTYHWLLIYECLAFHIEYLNDAPEPQVVAALKASRVAQDAAYLAFPRDRQGRERVSIDFEAFIGMYVWDTDVLLDASTYEQLGPLRSSSSGTAPMCSACSRVSCPIPQSWR